MVSPFHTRTIVSLTMISTMDADLRESIYKGLPASIAGSTKQSYIRFVANLKGKVDDRPFINYKWLSNVDAVVAAVEANYAPSTGTTIYNAITAVLRTSKVKETRTTLADIYQEKMKAGMARRKDEEGETTEKQEAYDMPWEEVVAKRDTLEGIDKVLLSLFTMIPPGRALEYATMEVGGGGGGAIGAGAPEAENRYTGTQFIIGKQKTSKDTGVVVVDVPKKLREVLDEWLDGRTSGLLLGGLTAPSITKHLNAIFAPKKIGVSALRHLYLQKYSGIKKEMVADAVAMRHSIGTALGTYVK